MTQATHPIMDELLTKYLDGAQYAEARAVAAGLRELALEANTLMHAATTFPGTQPDAVWLTTLRDGLRHGASVIDQLIAERKP